MNAEVLAPNRGEYCISKAAAAMAAQLFAVRLAPQGIAVYDIRPGIIRTDMTGGEVRICVSDRGPGIAAADLKHIFEPFWSSKPGGMGMGLAICRSIIAAHHGSLTAVNNPEGGVTFCATLPERTQA